MPIVVLVFLEVAPSPLTLKSQRARRIIEGTPSIIIEKGRVLENEMRRLRYNMDDMMARMREQGVYNIGDVEYAILETNGKLSLVLKAAKRPVTPRRSGPRPGLEDCPFPLVDGKLLGENLALAQKTEAWLKQALASSHQCTHCRLPPIAPWTARGNCWFLKKGETKKRPEALLTKWRAYQESNLGTRLRRPALYPPWSYRRKVTQDYSNWRRINQVICVEICHPHAKIQHSG